MTLSGQLKLDIIKLYYANGQSLSKSRCAMQRLYHKEGRRPSKTIIIRAISTFNIDLSLHPHSREGRPKSAIVDKNVAKIK